METKEILKSLFESIDVSDLGYQEINFQSGYAIDISNKLKNKYSYPLVFCFTEFIKDNLIYDKGSRFSNKPDVKIFIMFPASEKNNTENIDKAQIVLDRFVNVTIQNTYVDRFRDYNSNIKTKDHFLWNLSIQFPNQSKQQLLNKDLSGKEIDLKLYIINKTNC